MLKILFCSIILFMVREVTIIFRLKKIIELNFLFLRSNYAAIDF